MKETEKVGLLLAMGNSKKEIASKLHKSVNTVDNQAQELYRTYHCRNLADWTRKAIQRYTNVPVEDALINAMKDATILLAVSFVVFVAISYRAELFEAIKTSLTSILK